MDQNERYDIIRGYRRYLLSVRRGDRKEGEFQDEWERLHECLSHDPEVGWSLLLEIIKTAHADELSWLGTGPLESFIFDNAVTFADRIEAEIRSNPTFREAYAWGDFNGIPQGIWERFRGAMEESGTPYDEIWTWVDEELYPSS